MILHRNKLELLTILFPRYFGDATRGGEDDCKSCPCPLEDNKYAFLKDINMNFTSNMLLEALLSPAMHFWTMTFLRRRGWVHLSSKVNILEFSGRMILGLVLLYAKV